jgi:hypothetical protein
LIEPPSEDDAERSECLFMRPEFCEVAMNMSLDIEKWFADIPPGLPQWAVDAANENCT